MRLVNSKLCLDIQTKENCIDVLILEDKRVMSEVIRELWNQCNGGDGGFVLSENKILKMEKTVSVIINPFDLDFNSRKILSALHESMAKSASEYFLEKSDINMRIANLVEKIVLSEGYSGIVYNADFSWGDMFKLSGVRIDDTYSSMLERLVEYIKILSEYCNIRMFCLINIKCYLSHEQLEELYRNAFYLKVQLLLVESREDKKLSSENIYILDSDYCMIVK